MAIVRAEPGDRVTQRIDDPHVGEEARHPLSHDYYVTGVRIAH